MVVRVNKNANYTVMSNHHLKDPNLSLKAKGLLSVVLSLPDDWQYSMAGFMAIAKEKESSINAALKELKENGYLIITKKMPNQTHSGRIEYEWDFYECSCNPFRGAFEPTTAKQEPKKQGVENQGLEFQGLENQGQLNTNILNTNKVNTNGIDILGKPKTTRFIPPTVEEVKAYCDERGNDVDPEKFVAYYTSNGWRVGRNPMKDYKAAIRTWEKNSYGKPVNNTSNNFRSGGNEFTAYLESMGDSNE